MAAKIRIDSIAQLDGSITNELRATVDGEDVFSVIISDPMTIDCVIEKLELLAWKLKIHKQSNTDN